MKSNKRLVWIEATGLILIYLLLNNHNIASCLNIKENNSCYGNYHNFVKLECVDSEVILNVTKVFLGAKPAHKNCPLTTNAHNYKKECCQQEVGDCMMLGNNQMAARCLGKQVCEIQTVWNLLNDACQPEDTFPRFSNFMSVQYQCGIQGEKPTITTKAAQQTHSTSVAPKTTNQPKMPVTKTESSTFHPTTHMIRISSIESNVSSDFSPFYQKKSSMTGIIIGISCGFLGMLLSAFGLWMYCSRKTFVSSKTTKTALPPSSHFLENILSYSKTRKSFCKGYNNFSNLMPSTNQILTQRDGQHVQILRSPSDASDHSNQTQSSNLPSSTNANQSSTSSNVSSNRTHQHEITILNNFTNV